MKFAITTLGLGGGPVAVALGGIASKLWAIISPVGKVVAAFGAGYAAGTLLSEGIDWALSKLLGYETTLGGATYDMVQAIKQGFGGLMTWFGSLPERMVNVGREMITGLIGGIDSMWESLKAKVGAVGQGTIDWIKEKLGIHSPSRVFAEIGMHTMAGFEKGIADNEEGPLSALGGAAKKLAAIGAGVIVGGAPLGAAAAPAGGGSGATYNITINAPSGSDASALAALVAREIERIEAGRAARQRSRLRDTE